MGLLTPNQILRRVMAGYDRADAQTRAHVLELMQGDDSGHVFSSPRFGEWWQTGRISALPGFDGPDVVEQLLAAAGKGHGKAWLYLGRMYRYGAGVPQDLNRAMECFERATAYRIVDAMVEMGLIHETGLAGPPDREKAAGCYRDADSAGAFRLGLIELSKAAVLSDGAMQADGVADTGGAFREQIDSAIQSFTLAERYSIHSAAADCRHMSEVFRLLAVGDAASAGSVASAAPFRRLAVQAAFLHAEGREEEAAVLREQLWSDLEAMAKTAWDWRRLGSVYETAGSEDRARQCYIRAFAQGDTCAGALLALSQHGAGGVKGALLMGTQASLENIGPILAVEALEVELHDSHQYVPAGNGLIFRFGELYPLLAGSLDPNSKYAEQSWLDHCTLRDIVRSAFRVDARVPGKAGAQAGFLLHHLATRRPCRIRCRECGSIYDHPEIHVLRGNSRVEGVDGFQLLHPQGCGREQLLCPAGHAVIQSGMILVD